MFLFRPKKPEKENTQNRPGLIFKIAGTDKDGNYSSFLGQRVPDTFKLGGELFFVELGLYLAEILGDNKLIES